MNPGHHIQTMYVALLTWGTYGGVRPIGLSPIT